MRSPGVTARIRDRIAVTANLEGDRIAVLRGVEHPQLDRLVLADDAETGRFQKLDSTVAFPFMAGDQRVKRRLEAKRLGAGGNIMDDAIGDHEDRADAFRRHVGEPRVQRRKKPCAVGLAVSPAAFDDADVDIAERVQIFFELGARLFPFGRRVHRSSGCRFDRRQPRRPPQRVAVLMDERGAGQSQEQQAKAEGAEKSAALACIKAQSNEAEGDNPQPQQNGQGQKRREGDIETRSFNLEWSLAGASRSFARWLPA